MGTSKQPTHAVLHISNWDGERDILTSLCTRAETGDFFYFDSGKPVRGYHGDEVLKVWPLSPEPVESLQDRVRPWMLACFGAELSMLVKRLAGLVSRTYPRMPLGIQALDYLKRHNLTGSTLREGEDREPS